MKQIVETVKAIVDQLSRVQIAGAEPFAAQLEIALEASLTIRPQVQSTPLLSSEAKQNFKTAVVTMTTLKSALDDGRVLALEDQQSVNDAIAAMNEIASYTPPARNIFKEGTGFDSVSSLRDFITTPPDYVPKKDSGNGDRVASSMNRALASVTEVFEDLSHLNKLKGKLPTKVPGGKPYVIHRLPLVVTTKGYAGSLTNQLNRLDVKYVPMDHAIVLFDQYVIGFAGEADLLDSERLVRKGGNLKRIRGKGRISLALEAVNRRFHNWINPLAELNPIFRSPGNSLFWVWAAPSNLAHTLNPVHVAMPWSSLPSKDNITTKISSMREEAEKIEKLQLEALKQGNHLSVDMLSRLSHLREALDRTSGDAKKIHSPAEQAQRLELRKAETLRILQKDYGDLMAEIEDTRDFIKTLNPPKDKDLIVSKQKELRKLMKQFEEAKGEVSRRLARANR